MVTMFDFINICNLFFQLISACQAKLLDYLVNFDHVLKSTRIDYLDIFIAEFFDLYFLFNVESYFVNGHTNTDHNND